MRRETKDKGVRRCEISNLRFEKGQGKTLETTDEHR
jgi:hypothetical protein